MSKTCDIGSRRTPEVSELDVGDSLLKNEGKMYDAQVSYKNGEPVPYGTKGSTRPDWYHAGPPPNAVEVKNYKINFNKNGTPSISNLKSSLKKQLLQRKTDLPDGTIQRAFIDARGQGLTKADADMVKEALGDIEYDEIIVWFE